VKLGVIANARAGRLRRYPSTIRRLRAAAGADAVFVTGSGDELLEALDALRERGTDLLVIVGGDGSVTGTLTPLLRAWPPAPLPAIALTRGGTVNTIARSLGSPGPPERAVRLLLRSGERTVRRRALVEARAKDGEPHHGMIFVNGGGERWLEIYHEESSRGVPGALAVIARIAASVLTGGELARRVFAPFRAKLVVDGEAQPEQNYTLMAAAGIPEIGLGFAPFRTAGSDPDHIHFTATAADAAALLRELPALRLRHERKRSPLRHFALREARILTSEPVPWSLDAESFAPACELRVSAGPALDFVSTSGG
jgi:diacylglycerol kinase family enzyme